MNVLILLILLSLFFSGGALILFLKSSARGQFDSLSALDSEESKNQGTGQGAHLPFDEEIVRVENKQGSKGVQG